MRHGSVAVAVALVAQLLYVSVAWARDGERLYAPGDYVTHANDGVVLVEPPVGAASHRWRVYVKVPGAMSEVDVTVRDAVSDEVMTVTRVSRFGAGAWTDMLPARAMLLTTEDATGVDVGAVGVMFRHTEPETPVGPNNVDLFVNAQRSNELVHAAKGIGRFSIASELALGTDNATTSDTIFCTVFLVRPTVVMTAGHCVAGLLENRFSEIWFEYFEGATVARSHRLTARVVQTSSRLDAALLELDRALPDELVLELALEPLDAGERKLVALQHFGGGHLAVSEDVECKIREYGTKGPPAWDTDAGREATVADAAFLHGCDTSKSSSGSPILDAADYRVVGMHRRGYGKTDRQLNQAIRADYLATWMNDSLQGKN